jgi:hypothetical protein|tara:strand:+ start:276 stop:563 length:288 start_codon:yes stop_codon:yes gene_type:complete
MKYSKGEIENSKRIFKSATPKQTTDWYVKWSASLVLLLAMVVRASGVSPFIDTCLSFIGCAGWLYVSIAWKDRALIMLNAVACFILLTGILTQLG